MALLAKSVNNYTPDWEDRLGDCLAAYRLSISDVTAHTPFFLLYRPRVRTPLTRLLQPRTANRSVFIVGEIGATLFGTATEDQVAQLKHHITKAQRTNRRIVDATNELISVVNQTRAEVSLNRQHLVAVEQFAKEVYAELVTYSRVLDGFVGSLIALEESTKIDRILSAPESVHNLWLRESDRYQHQRASLEMGQLTKEILPPPDADSGE